MNNDPRLARAHATVSIAALRSLFGTAAAKERDLEAIDVGPLLALRTRTEQAEMNRVVGLGTLEPASDAAIEKLDRLYGRAHVPFLIQLHPSALPADLPERLAKRGFDRDLPWTVLHRGAADPPAEAGRVTVRRASRREAELYGSILVHAFGMALAQRPLFSATVGRKGWDHYIAYVGETPAGAASMYVEAGACLFGGSATLSDSRRQGVQRALTAQRVRDAIAEGCADLFIETAASFAEGQPEELTSATQAGFAPAFELASFVYRKGFRQVFDSATKRWV